MPILSAEVAHPPYTSKDSGSGGWLGSSQERELELHLSVEDCASIVEVVGILETEAAKLDPTSEIGAMWRDWGDLLVPTVQECCGPLALSSPPANVG